MTGTPELYELTAALDVLDESMNIEAAKRAAGNSDVRSLDECLELLLELKVQQRRLASVINEVERTAAGQITQRRYLGRRVKAEKSRTHDDTWDVRRCAWDVVEPLLCDHTTGEVLCDEKTAWSIIDRLFRAASVKYYRTTELEAMGLKPGDYRVREFRRYTVKVERVDTEAAAS